MLTQFHTKAKYDTQRVKIDENEMVFIKLSPDLNKCHILYFGNMHGGIEQVALFQQELEESFIICAEQILNYDRNTNIKFCLLASRISQFKRYFRLSRFKREIKINF